MSCATVGTSYDINGSTYTVPSTGDAAYTANNNVCNATKILDSLHKDFTVELSTTTLDANKDKPSYYLRNQPINNSDATKTNRFYDTMTPATGTIDEPKYRKMISVIMKGVEDNSETYDRIPSTITTLTGFSDQLTAFKGIYGLNKVVELLDANTNTLLTGLTTSIPANADSGDAISKYNKRNDIKNTLEEIAYRENQIYREKFLNIILIVVGIILVGSQLTQKFFSGGGGAGGGGGGLGGLFGFGVGGSGGLFSRFGGLGLGSSGRSHFDIGNLFKNSSYTLKQR